MNLLVSAYACAPNRGSEHGSAWNWVTEVCRQGHCLTVLVSPAHTDSILAAARQDPSLSGINWVFPKVRGWPLVQNREPKWERTYNLLWQLMALRAAKTLHQAQPFDLVHHLTWGGVRAPTFLASLGVPLVIGPIGGGETSPHSLRDQFPPRGRFLESLRDISNATIEINPLVRRGLQGAAVIFARTDDTRNLLSAPLREKTRVLMELGVSTRQIGSPRQERPSPRRLLYAGRLLYWKGVHIAIEAMATLVQRMPDAHLTIVGNGPEEARLQQEIAQRQLGDNIEFISWMPQDQFMRLYDSHDVFLFPSLHDSTGWVVLEALCKGMPVLCLDLGGPKDIVTPECGVVVGTHSLNTSAVAARMASQLYDLLADPARLAHLSDGAISRAHDFLLSDQVARLYDTAWQVIRNGNTGRAGAEPRGMATTLTARGSNRTAAVT